MINGQPDLSALLVDPAATMLAGAASAPPLRPEEIEDLSRLVSLDGAALAQLVTAWMQPAANEQSFDDPLMAIGLAFALEGNLFVAGELFRSRLRSRLVVETMRLQVFQQRQRDISRRDRPDGLQELLIELVRQQPDISSADALEALTMVERGPVIDFIGDGMIEWRDVNNPAGETPIRALPSRLTRARKKVSLTG